MPSVKLTWVSALAAFGLAGCGAVSVKPSGTTAAGVPASRGRVDAPTVAQPNHVRCLRANRLAVEQIDNNDLLVADVVRVHFAPTPAIAEGDQIENREQGAEVIGSALVYPGHASDAELTTIESCLAQGVKETTS